tara:strand:- start:5358 stop:5840 length:483 start_codon:yes stop_codon:yes gene_type:complete
MKKTGTYIVISLLFLATMAFTVSANTGYKDAKQNMPRHVAQEANFNIMNLANESNETREVYKSGTGYFWAYGTGNGTVSGYGYAELTDFTGNLSYLGAGEVELNGCDASGPYSYDCVNGYGNFSGNNSMTVSFDGVGHIYAAGTGEAWFKGYGSAGWGKL